jgi:hypothetical protein
MVRKISLLISAYCLITSLTLITRPFTTQGGGGGCYAPKGPFKQLTGEFQYDYKRFGAVGKDWESSCTPEMPYAAVNANARINPEDGHGDWPAVEFIVWFLGPMRSDNPKCIFEITDGGQVLAFKGATKHQLKVIAVP